MVNAGGVSGHGHSACCKDHDLSSIQHLLDNNKKWRDQVLQKDPQFFERTAKAQAPRYLWIGCSDSRVPAEEITGLNPGEMFVHRNVANLVVSNDINTLSVVQFSVEKLKVKDIIVCGHYGCGGITAALKNAQIGLLDNWLRNIRDVCRTHKDELSQYTNDEERERRLVEINIQEQCLNIFKINMVQRRMGLYGSPRIHGMVYDIRSGILKELEVDYHGFIAKHMGVFTLHSFRDGKIPVTKPEFQRNMILNLVEDHEEDSGKVSIRYISRMLKKEVELFTEEEVDSAINAIQEQSKNPESMLVEISSLVSYFAGNDTTA
ncbi:carbonic anhydrase [Plasmopara halstedii]|uniref:Carbonic anhydrase n=1 Tax=Plasmopara halstedii TaxID=4781 RepID=A0A0P1A7B4_PLAHL|nr:carbonic anhydrase [Plasmopara halstedii]CEG35882.1 carbonic anhydrase [Plasmopara halstedii]|eukprot:XP_024572251.1 carbonic anhydrase [Plasmopara halstedii]